MTDCPPAKSDERWVLTGSFSSSMTIFSTAVTLILVQNDLSVAFAGTLSAALANSLSDGTAVSTGSKRGWKTFWEVALSEAVLGISLIIFLLIWTFMQRNTHGAKYLTAPTRRQRAGMVALLALVNIIFVLGSIYFYGGDFDEQKGYLLKALAIPAVVLFTVTVTILTERGLFPSKPIKVKR